MKQKISSVFFDFTFVFSASAQENEGAGGYHYVGILGLNDNVLSNSELIVINNGNNIFDVS